MGAPARKPVFTEAASMVNLLDDALPAKMPQGPIRTLIQTYGKGIRKGRKLGHMTLIGPDASEIRREAGLLISELHDA
jgi:5-(carboxyamino)imidazole ribonucleotide synthase